MYKILFIEDDPDQLFLFEKVFALKELETISTGTMNETMKLIETEKPDVILLDIMLKGENGLDILEKIKRVKKYANIPAIVFTNTNKPEYKDRAMKLGAIDYIIKAKTTPQEMAEKLKGIIAGRRV